MAASPIPHDRFDEAGYLRLYPDVVAAIAAGVIPNGRDHYLNHGRREGRQPNDVDAAFYLQAYPQAAADIAAGRAEDAVTHYLRLGIARGYRPNAAAPTPEQSAMPTCFPWLWTDLPHAADLIDGRRNRGALSERQATLLHQWVRDGYVVLEDPFDPRMLAAAALDLERGFAGACPDLLFSCGAVALGPVPWQPEINPYPAVALDIHYMSRAVRDLLFAEPLAELLGLLFETPALLAHSRGMLREAAQPPQRDAAGGAYTLERQWLTALVLLDDTDPASVACFPGSHRLPDSAGAPLDRQMVERDIQAEPMGGKRGRVVFRHPVLVHRADAVPEGGTRRVIMAQYCPRYVAPRYAEHLATQVWPHGGDRFTTQYYTAIDPLD